MIVVASVSALLGIGLVAPSALAQGVVAGCRDACARLTSESNAAPMPPAVPRVLGPPPPFVPAAPTTPVPVAQAENQAVAQPDEGITVSAALHVRYDPLERVNKVSFDAIQAVDRAVVAPVSNTYERVVPEPVRDGIHNMVHNLREPYIAANFLLQHRVGKSVETVVRFAINSTIGLVGLFDIARRKPIRLPRRANGFADTMGFYGVKTGPYLFLPLVGPTTVRDLIGNSIDRLILPLAAGKVLRNPAYVAPALLFGAMDRRLQNNGRITRSRDSANPYTTLREDYLLRRRIEIEGLHYHRPAKGTPKPEAAAPPAP